MGRNSPSLAAGLAATAVLLGLTMAGVDVPPRSAETTSASSRGSLPTPGSARPAIAAKPIGTAAVRAAVAVRTRGSTCSAGLVALTFDDGPNPAVTGRLVRTLRELKVPATFFMVGAHVDAHPELARLVQRNGFVIANHTWNHPMLTHRSNPEIRDQLLATRSAFARHHLAPSRLMRPPYGDIDGRVRRVVRELGLIPVLWSIDSRDWAGGDAVAIAHRILVGLRPHRTNLVLQHDGVENSPASLAAVPIVVRKARERGYCFTHLDATGGVGGRSAPTAARLVLPVQQTSGTSSTTTTAARTASTATHTRTTLRATRGSRLLFASRAALQMPRSAYLHVLAVRLGRH